MGFGVFVPFIVSLPEAKIGLVYFPESDFGPYLFYLPEDHPQKMRVS